MTEDHISVSFECGNCGTKFPASAIEESPSDDSVVTCQTCGQTFRYGDIKEHAKQAVLNRMRAQLREAVRRK